MSLTSDQERFIQERTKSFLARVLNNPGRFIHCSKHKYTSQHRGEIFARTEAMLKIMGIQYTTKRDNYHGFYKLAVTKAEDKKARDLFNFGP